MAAIPWQEWSSEAFARARAEGKPVLLSITATWCASSREMETATYGNPSVAATIADRFVPIRVDADRRPDIAERYTLGGLPTTAFLNAEGAILGGGTFVSADRMPSVLARLLEAFGSSEEARAGVSRIEAAPSPDDAHTDAPEDLLAAVFSTFDDDHGGFGIEPKFPLVAPLQLALDWHRASPEPRMAHVIETTLDAMGWGGLYDEVDGGFFRLAARRDWESPHLEKMLDVNAALLRLYVDASEALQIARYRERAEGVLRYVQTSLADQADGGWAASQRADAEYYAADDPASRQARTPPPIDPVLYSAANAAMASSALRAAEVFDDVALGEFALKSLERVLMVCYAPGAGVAHAVGREPLVRGLLTDQVAMAEAQLDAHAATGNIVYEMMAQELMLYALRTMWDDEAGGFFDRTLPHDTEGVGLMRTRLKPFVLNCDAARLLRRLADTTGDRQFADRADATLAAIGPGAARQGPLAAHYLLALGPQAPGPVINC